MPLAPATRLGRYEIRSPLGAGGMGEVYLAEDTQLDRLVALKILGPEVSSDQQYLNRFMQEAKSAAALSHPNIAHIYEVGLADGISFIAMEYVEGVLLRDRMTNVRMTLIEAIEIIIQVASALAASHAAGIVHR